MCISIVENRPGVEASPARLFHQRSQSHSLPLRLCQKLVNVPHRRQAALHRVGKGVHIRRAVAHHGQQGSRATPADCFARDVPPRAPTEDANLPVPYSDSHSGGARRWSAPATRWLQVRPHGACALGHVAEHHHRRAVGLAGFIPTMAATCCLSSVIFREAPDAESELPCHPLLRRAVNAPSAIRPAHIASGRRHENTRDASIARRPSPSAPAR